MERAVTWILCVALLVNPAFAVVRIMALGDSITGSPGCWRAVLWQKLQTADLAKKVKFVGTLPGQGCGFPYDGDNEGHGGILATNLAKEGQLPKWLQKAKPDIVMTHLGTNDAWNNKSPNEITGAFSKLVDQMRASKPTMKILFAKIIPLNPKGCSGCEQRVVELNKAIERWASTKSSAASPIITVDCFTGFKTATDTKDGVHPNDKGNQKLAKCWYEPLVSIIRSSL